MKIFLDTNIFIRFITADNLLIYKECCKLIDIIQKGKIHPYTSNIVLQETLYVLTKIYKHSKKKALYTITTLIKLRNLTIIESTDTKQALQLYSKHNIKFGDCLIATQIPPNATLATYDTDFKKIKTLHTATPKELLKNFAN